IQFRPVVYGDGAGNRVHRLRLPCCADRHLLQRQGAGTAAFFQHDVVIAEAAVVQVAARKQALQGFFCGHRAADAGRRHVLRQ
nr:hypothetical protein [Tanacetum cinerariifolium]